ncbi:PREDICTED: fatty acid synthase-like [Polistes canadensis]|uniref:fatty acid synthase-like n=1 Tax=Polistes canadensis TaxID=91411 RepID=UPI000718C7E9|nr:PREDICTED: fatty acid synthase-like [Polistes canadensis]
MIPKNAITIEISPHGLLQAILKQSLSPDCINLALTRRGNKDNSILLLSALGKLYNLGVRIMPGKLYSRIPYPVSRGTPSISSLFRWEHSTDWYVSTFSGRRLQLINEHSFLLDLESDEYNSPFKISSGKFEVKTKKRIMISSGTIRVVESENEVIPENIIVKKETELLYEEDIYSNLLSHGYQYEEPYNIISRLSTSCSNGTFKWSSDWRFLLEGLIQVHIISSRNKNILMPNKIQQLIIDIGQLTDEMKKNNALPMKFDKRVNIIFCPGVTMIGIQFKKITIENDIGKIVADELRFIQNMEKREMDMDDVCNFVLGFISDNISKSSTETIMVAEESQYENENIIECLYNTLERTKENFTMKLIAREWLNQTLNENYVLMIINNAHFNDVRNFINTTGKESFLLTIIKTEDEDNAITAFTSLGLKLVLNIKIVLHRTALLLQKEKKLGKTVIVNRQENSADQLKICLRDSKYDNVIFLVNTNIDNDIFEILKSIKGESEYKKLQIFDLQDEKAPKFSLKNEFYENQIKLNLRKNVLLPNGVWGTYRWMPLQAKSTSPSRWQAKIDKSGSLVWVEELPLIKEKNRSVVKVEFASFDLNAYEFWLNNDVNLESHISLIEYSGRDEKGRRVMGLVNNLTISNEILPDPDFTWVIPETLSFEEAATIPHAYLAAFSILHSNTLRFKHIKSILIHYGASDVGQALINVSLSYNFDVYTTYETEAEKRVIESIRPRLPRTHIININNYKSNILNITKGKGIDFVVANHFILEDINTSLDILNDLQHFAIIYDSKEPCYSQIALAPFIRHLSMYSYCMQDLIRVTQNQTRVAAELMRKALQTGSLKPIISRRLFLQGTTDGKKNEACERYGKVLVSLQEKKGLSKLIPKLLFHSDKCYLVIDGFNTFGMGLIEWMIEQGVRNLFIASNKLNRYPENLVFRWRENGATVIIREEVDMNKETSFENLLKEAVSIGQLDGIFDLQRTKIDSSISSSKYFNVTELLDKCSRKLCPSHVKFFIFSSLNLDEDGLRDPNVEKLCKERNESGRHGLFILLPNFVENTLNETHFKNIYYTKMSLFLKQLSALLSTDASLIAVRQIIKDHSVHENESNIVAAETDKKQKSNEAILQEEVRRFEQYIYGYAY